MRGPHHRRQRGGVLAHHVGGAFLGLGGQHGIVQRDADLLAAPGLGALEQRKQAWRDIETRMATQAYILVNGDRGMKLAASERLRTLAPFYSVRLWDSSLADK